MKTSSDALTVARVIVSQENIPSRNLGSWTQRITYLLQEYLQNEIDFLLCGPTTEPFLSARTQRIICNYWKQEIVRDWFYPIKYRAYTQALKSIIQRHDLTVIMIIDNTKLKNIVSSVIAKNGWENKCRVIFMQCGFSYEFTRDEYRSFRQGLHEVVLLTQKSYEFEMNKYHEYPFLVNVLNSPVRTDLFFKPTAGERSQYRSQLGIAESEKVFLWVSHDRPKKGLDLMLMLWPLVIKKYPGSKLVVIGAKRNIELPGLVFKGKIPNVEIARYYQSADVFLFSSLCQDAFPLSLAEALSCGCFCIASDVGGVSEFFSAGNGILVKHPNQVEAWLEAIDRYYSGEKLNDEQSQTSLLTYDEWCGRLMNIFNNSIQFLIQSSNR